MVCYTSRIYRNPSHPDEEQAGQRNETDKRPKGREQPPGPEPIERTMTRNRTQDRTKNSATSHLPDLESSHIMPCASCFRKHEAIDA